MINILLDENMPFDLIQLFEQFGFSVYHIKKLGKTGIKNGEVYELSLQLNAWIITRDTDFENLLKFQQYNPKGIVVLKTQITITAYALNIFRSLLEQSIIAFSQQQLIVIDEKGITIINHN
jgi:predicted nuclease of predicted toxin-antitoxin system